MVGERLESIAVVSGAEKAPGRVKRNGVRPGTQPEVSLRGGLVP